MAELSLRNVKKIYDGNVVAVQEFNLEIADKEFIVLVGPSGCGKSTTLRMVAGLEEISEGEISIGGRVVNNVPPKDRDIAMVFQNYALYPHMTVYDNIAYGLRLRKFPKKVIDQKVREAAAILDITELLKRRPKALSGGQRQRVAIGRAIVREPQVFLMDEPLSNLDAKLRNQMRSEIIKIRKRVNTTFIYVTHDQTEAMTLGDRIVIMRDGFVQQVGTPQEVFHHPANLFVAGFIGMPQMNFFDAQLLLEGGRYFVELANLRVELSEEKQCRLRQNGVQAQAISLGVRPEHISLTEGEGIEAEVDVSEMMGSSIHIHVGACGADVVIVVPVSEEELERDGELFASGSGLRFTFRGSVAHVFDKETGHNLEAHQPQLPEEPEGSAGTEDQAPEALEDGGAAEAPQEEQLPLAPSGAGEDLGDPFAEND
ncbi:MAG: sn-glycerol-3-phosphate ABC transporter ATP-binding protein UgpC [Oscillospiraceae bacterium]|nr:sn-glycerol-3-phosphate ABC transporter ATP-binding protein UgpC [Oscillospiraceae bacterium]MCI8877442.1 sn-glycerol-3-phosphate ABC transporter ATP-binding protein UgpC [Oscillospiraceae bacterium]